jgi:hypothetical protein
LGAGGIMSADEQHPFLFTRHRHIHTYMIYPFSLLYNP